jgi:hypothetical protein
MSFNEIVVGRRGRAGTSRVAGLLLCRHRAAVLIICEQTHLNEFQGVLLTRAYRC